MNRICSSGDLRAVAYCERSPGPNCKLLGSILADLSDGLTAVAYAKLAVAGESGILAQEDIAILRREIDGAGVAPGISRTIPYSPNGTVVKQGDAPVCGPACAAMVISDATGTSVSLQNTIGSFVNGIRPTGVNALEISTVISNAGISNTVQTRMLPNQLTQALSDGQTVIVNVRGHFFIVDSQVTVNGASYYMTRDPWTGPRGVLASALDAAISDGANAIVVGK